MLPLAEYHITRKKVAYENLNEENHAVFKIIQLLYYFVNCAVICYRQHSK